MMLVESKYFQCEECEEYSIRLIFAPGANTPKKLVLFADMMRSEIEKEDCEVWVIGRVRA